MNPIIMNLFSVHLIAVSHKSGLKMECSPSTKDDDGRLELGSQYNSKCFFYKIKFVLI